MGWIPDWNMHLGAVIAITTTLFWLRVVFVCVVWYTGTGRRRDPANLRLVAVTSNERTRDGCVLYIRAGEYRSYVDRCGGGAVGVEVVGCGVMRRVYRAGT